MDDDWIQELVMTKKKKVMLYPIWEMGAGTIQRDKASSDDHSSDVIIKNQVVAYWVLWYLN